MPAVTMVPLGDVATVERSSVQPDDIRPGTVYVGLEDIESGGRILRARQVDPGDLASTKFSFTESHVLYGKLRPYLAKIAAPDFAGICSTDIVPILPGPLLDRRYLLHFLRQPTMIAFARARSVGINLPRLSPSVLETFPVPLPPLPEQRRIAAILDQADALRAMRRTALAELATLTQSVFLEMFGDPATNPKRWPLMPVAKIGRVVTGNTPSRAVPDYFGDDIEWIKSDNINTPDDFVTPATEGLSASGRAVARVAPPSSILVTCIAGSPNCIGNSAITDRMVAFNQQINALIPEQGDVNFIYGQLVVGKRLIQRASTASMKGMVSKSRFESVEIMFPPVDLQHEFARRISVVRTLKQDHSDSLAHMDALFASLQQQAFRGEL